MNYLKTQILKLNDLYFNIILSVGFAVLLLLFRMKIAGSFYYLFLIWNLFLAGIPFAITQLLKHRTKLRSSKIPAYLVFGVWLLFLPNSPYIITDLVHLNINFSNLMWLDLFLVFVFAFNGVLLGVLSMLDMFEFLKERYDNRIAKHILFQVCLLSGYGIYLGRFLRFNSWDITTKPTTLLVQITQSIYEPKAWLITFAFGGFLWILFSLLQAVMQMREHQVQKISNK